MIWKRAEIGILLLPCGSLASFFLFNFGPLGDLIGNLYMSYQIDNLTLSIIKIGPYVASAIAGFALYISGRKEFLNHVKGDKITSVSLMILSMVQIITSVFLNLLICALFNYYNTKIPGHPLTGGKLVGYLLPFGWSVLWLILGLLWLADGTKLVKIPKIPARAQRLDPTVLGLVVLAIILNIVLVFLWFWPIIEPPSSITPQPW